MDEGEGKGVVGVRWEWKVMGWGEEGEELGGMRKDRGRGGDRYLWGSVG